MRFPLYHVATPSRAMVVSGKKNKDEVPAIYLNQGKWVAPWRQISWMALKAHTVTVSEICPTKERVNFNFTAAITFHVGHDKPAIQKAIQLWGEGKDEVITRADGQQVKLNPLEAFGNQTLIAHLRGVVGKNTIEEIMDDRQKLASTVMKECEDEFATMGLQVKSFRIQHITDSQGSTYLQDMGASSRSAIKAQAEIAEAVNAQKATEAQQTSEQAQLQARQATSVKNSDLQASIDRAAAIAAQAKPLQEAESQQAVITKQQQLAVLNAELREQQLIAEAIKPQEAAARQIQINAEANRQQAEIQAQADANSAVFAAQGAAKVATEQANAQVAAAEGRARVAEQAAKAADAEAKAITALGTANASKITAEGTAEADVRRLLNEAAATGDKVSIELAAIEAAPKVAKELAAALAGGEKIFYNGLEGGMLTLQSLATMVPQIVGGMRTMASQMMTSPTSETEEHRANGQAPQPAHF